MLVLHGIKLKRLNDSLSAIHKNVMQPVWSPTYLIMYGLAVTHSDTGNIEKGQAIIVSYPFSKRHYLLRVTFVLPASVISMVKCTFHQNFLTYLFKFKSVSYETRCERP